MLIEHYEQTRGAFTKEIGKKTIFFASQNLWLGEGSEPDSAMHLKYIHISSFLTVLVFSISLKKIHKEE